MTNNDNTTDATFEEQDRDACRLVQRLIEMTGADYALIRISKEATPCAVKLSWPDGREVTRVGKTIYEALIEAQSRP
jgi:hypothetical protein